MIVLTPLAPFAAVAAPSTVTESFLHWCGALVRQALGIDVALCREDDRFSSTPRINAFVPKLVFNY